MHLLTLHRQDQVMHVTLTSKAARIALRSLERQRHTLLYHRKKPLGAQPKSTAESYNAPGKCYTSPDAQSYSKAMLLLTPTVMADAALGVQQGVQASGILGTGGIHSRQCGSCRPGVS